MFQLALLAATSESVSLGFDSEVKPVTCESTGSVEMLLNQTSHTKKAATRSGTPTTPRVSRASSLGRDEAKPALPSWASVKKAQSVTASHQSLLEEADRFREKSHTIQVHETRSLDATGGLLPLRRRLCHHAAHHEEVS